MPYSLEISAQIQYEHQSTRDSSSTGSFSVAGSVGSCARVSSAFPNLLMDSSLPCDNTRPSQVHRISTVDPLEVFLKHAIFVVMLQFCDPSSHSHICYFLVVPHPSSVLPFRLDVELLHQCTIAAILEASGVHCGRDSSRRIAKPLLRRDAPARGE